MGCSYGAILKVGGRERDVGINVISGEMKGAGGIYLVNSTVCRREADLKSSRTIVCIVPLFPWRQLH